MTHVDEQNAAVEAWEDWRRCKLRSDQTLSFTDCHETAQAWVRFQNLYLGHSNKLAIVPAPPIPQNSGGRA